MVAELLGTEKVFWVAGLMCVGEIVLLLASAGEFTGGAFVAVMASSVLKALGQGAAQPSLQAASIKKVGRERSGSATSTYYLGADIGQGIAPMIAGVIVGGALTPLKGYIISFNMTAVLLTLAMAGLALIYRQEKAKRFSKEP